MSRILAVLVLLLALCLAIGGVWLITLGGSWYYALAAIGLFATGLLLLKSRPAALIVYAIVLGATLIWAIYEAGFDWWNLQPRGGVLVLIGALLLLPWTTRDLDPAKTRRWRAVWSGAALPLAGVLLVSIAVGGYSMATPSHAISGVLSESAATTLPASEAGVPPGDWRAYGRTEGGSHYSPLDAITADNVADLEEVWHYHTGDVRLPEDPEETTYEVTPVKIGDTLYLCTPHQIAIALDPETGEELWRYDSGSGVDGRRQHQTCRGLSYYEAEGAAASAPCGKRLFLPTADARLIALDATTGDVCTEFGTDGAVDLSANLPHFYAGSYYSTSPPVVAGGLIVVGGAVNDNVSTTEPSGVIRAYDVDTGELVWNFDTGNPDCTAPLAAGETYTPNSPNAWSMLSVDPALGLVYAPIGNAPPDQWGGDRTPETERFSSSVIALDLETGALRWVFQTVHHDLWDMDVPSQPQLVDLEIDGGMVPALVQATKQGDIYVLDRRTGEPILPVTEVAAPQGATEGDFTAPTQPVSALSFEPEPLREANMWGATLLDQLWCRIEFRSLDYEGRYTPPSTNGTLVYPGNFGVFNWGGVAVDPVRNTVFANPVYLAFTVKLIPRADDQTSYVSEAEPGFNENFGAPFAAEMRPFWSPLGLPCQGPPWGYVAAADLRTGAVIWQHKNGTVRDLAPLPLPFEMGVPAIGGPIVTAGGVMFHSGTLDYYVRAFDVQDGAELWRERLPAGGQATPMTYLGDDGRQYLVVVAGGHGSTGTKAGDSIIAYALPAR
ncbi:MAG: glucose/quinate/shikimate family membrane-bound PQQ-dependent dehydrogenase [Dongiaceae bacterium]